MRGREWRGGGRTCPGAAAAVTKEAQTALRVARAWGYVDEHDIAPSMQLLDRELGLLWGLTERRQRR